MNNISTQQPHSLYSHRPSIPERPIAPTEPAKENTRQIAVTAIETKQQQQLVQTYINASQQANSEENSNSLQELARLAKNHLVVQQVNENDGKYMKSIAEKKQEKVEEFYRNIQNSNEL